MAKDGVRYRFDEYVLDTSDRQLWRGEVPVDLNARYFDALVLLVERHGRLVGKEEFFAEVWGDVVVGDSALTQCIKDIRRLLGDEAGNPSFIQTVPRHGYRFVADVEVLSGDVVGPAREAARLQDVHRPENQSGGLTTRSSPTSARAFPWAAVGLWGGAGAVGGAVAGVMGGLLYGSALAYHPAAAELGTASILLVLLALNILVGFVGAAGVSFGMAALSMIMHRRLTFNVSGAALGGLLVGGGVKLLGVDAFNLLFGRAPAGITGGIEGAILGGAIAMGAWLGGRSESAPSWRPIVGAGVCGAAAGALIPSAGGNLMGGSLELLARSFDGSRLHLDALGGFFGEVHFGQTSQIVLGGVEGLVFGSCVVGALMIARGLISKGDSQAGAYARPFDEQRDVDPG